MEEKEGKGSPSHHPLAPSSELFNISTTIDPSYIISLIRKLLPHEATNHGSQGVNNHSVSANGSDKDSNSLFGVSNYRANENAAVGTLVDLDGPAYQKPTLDYGEEKQQFVDEICQNSPAVDDRMDHEYGVSDAASDYPGASTSGDPWEESGCILWDLAANETHAEFMVENLLLDVLLANLNFSRSACVTEICLGIIANLACHEVPKKAITSRSGFIQTVLDQLFSDDSLCLTETCRLLSSCLQGCGSITSAEALLPDHILDRMLWIAGNTLNTQLLIKCLELFLVILDNQEVTQVLLPPLMKLGLPNVLVNLLSCEISNLTSGKEPERCLVLELILCVVESLSTIESYSQVISSNNQLFQLVYSVMKLPEKVEVVTSCVTAVVLIANILTDEPNLVLEISEDLSFLRGLLEILPFVSDDSQARSALWSILARILVQVEENKMTPSNLQQYALLLIDNSELIEDDLDDHQFDSSTESDGFSNSCIKLPEAMKTSLRRTADILDRWIITNTDTSEKDLKGAAAAAANSDSRVRKLLHYCHKYIT